MKAYKWNGEVQMIKYGDDVINKVNFTSVVVATACWDRHK